MNLSLPIKNVKRYEQQRRADANRDFSNGYLVAEIMSRYHPGDVQMHSFDNGVGIATKKNNWGLLDRVFRVSAAIVRVSLFRNIKFQLRQILSLR